MLYAPSGVTVSCPVDFWCEIAYGCPFTQGVRDLVSNTRVGHTAR